MNLHEMLRRYFDYEGWAHAEDDRRAFFGATPRKNLVHTDDVVGLFVNNKPSDISAAFEVLCGPKLADRLGRLSRLRPQYDIMKACAQAGDDDEWFIHLVDGVAVHDGGGMWRELLPSDVPVMHGLLLERVVRGGVYVSLRVAGDLLVVTVNGEAYTVAFGDSVAHHKAVLFQVLFP